MSYTQPEMMLYSYTYIFGITSYILYIYPILHTYAIAVYIHYLNGPAVLSSCASLNLGDVSLSGFRSYAHCHGLTVRLARLRRGVLACLCSAVFKDLKYMISRQSHGFSYNLGIIALTTGINCTRYRSCNYFARCSCNYSQIALESM